MNQFKKNYVVNFWRYVKLSKTTRANTNLSKALGRELLRKKKVYESNKLRDHIAIMVIKLHI